LTTSNNGLPANILEALAKSNLTGSQRRVVDAIWLLQPEPLGSLDITLFTGLDQRHVMLDLTDLEKYKVIQRSYIDNKKLGRGIKPLTMLNLNFQEWEIPHNPRIKVHNKSTHPGALLPEKVHNEAHLSNEKSTHPGALLLEKVHNEAHLSNEKSTHPGALLLDNNIPQQYSASQKDEIAALIMKLIDEREFEDTINDRFREDLDEFVEDYRSPIRWIKDAFDEAKSYKAYSWGYVRKILINWQRRGKPNGAKRKSRGVYADRRHTEETPGPEDTGERGKNDIGPLR
jgi:DnaD/phage-associated family protein